MPIKIISLPEFIDKYIKLGYPLIKDYSDAFSNSISKYEAEKFSFVGKAKLVIRDIRDTDYAIINFLELYFALSGLDCKYRCVYEDELDIPKSTDNESFIIEYNQVKYKANIEEFDDGTLVFEAV